MKLQQFRTQLDLHFRNLLTYIKSRCGQKKRKKTTKDWEFLAKWKDASTNWISLKDMKESHTPQVAEYAVASRIDQEPAFAWWVPYGYHMS